MWGRGRAEEEEEDHGERRKEAGREEDEGKRKRGAEETEWMKLDSKLYKASRETDALGFTERSPLLKKNKAPACCLSRLHIPDLCKKSGKKKSFFCAIKYSHRCTFKQADVFFFVFFFLKSCASPLRTSPYK